MSPRIKLWLLPLLGTLLFAAAFVYSRRELLLRLGGEHASGRVVGILITREDGRSDLISRLETSLTLTLADGGRIEGRWINDAALQLPEDLSPAQRTLLQDVRKGDAATLRWVLMREARRSEDPRRVVAVERSDVWSALLDLRAVPDTLTLTEEGSIVADNIPMGEIHIHTRFDHSDPKTVRENKGESLVDFQHTRNGTAVEDERKNFLLNREPHSTVFRPVCVFEHAKGSQVVLSHIGRHGGPTLALKLHEPVRVYFDPVQPERAAVFADPGPLRADILGWFSQFCEGLFGQWGSTALIVIGGLTCWMLGIILLSLHLRPGKNLIRHE